jgi:hypothetical protein
MLHFYFLGAWDVIVHEVFRTSWCRWAGPRVAGAACPKDGREDSSCQRSKVTQKTRRNSFVSVITEELLQELCNYTFCGLLGEIANSFIWAASSPKPVIKKPLQKHRESAAKQYASCTALERTELICMLLNDDVSTAYINNRSRFYNYKWLIEMVWLFDGFLNCNGHSRLSTHQARIHCWNELWWDDACPVCAFVQLQTSISEILIERF